MHHTLIGGLGNVLMGDDAIGPTVVAHLAARFVFPEGVKLHDLGTPGMDLVLHLAGLRNVVLIDALANSTLPAGAIRVVRREELLAGPASAGLDAHSPGLREALLLTEHCGGVPEQVCVVGVVAEDCSLGAGLSDSVRKSVAGLVEAVVDELRLLCVSVQARVPPGEPETWWER
ncbi:MAG TPA: hydrogenase maturation protease [Paludibaculum sp.]|jgi:hydrogenase maturation protease